MSKTDGITRSRNKVDSYKGFSIIKVLAVYHWYNNYDRRYEMSKQYETKREVYYEFCKEGDENRPAQAYGVYPTPKSVETAKEAIDKMLSGEEIYFTDAEREQFESDTADERAWNCRHTFQHITKEDYLDNTGGA